ncbi:Obscurin [Varanus komodoensis]|nr:Obscurin [Varanus komodoensis]
MLLEKESGDMGRVTMRGQHLSRSSANPATPPFPSSQWKRFLSTRGLQSKEAEEGNTVSLRCELSKPMAPVVWKKGNVVLRPSDKYDLRQEGNFAELLIYDLEAGDDGQYTCESQDHQTTATVKVKGKSYLGQFRTRPLVCSRGIPQCCGASLSCIITVVIYLVSEGKPHWSTQADPFSEPGLHNCH